MNIHMKQLVVAGLMAFASACSTVAPEEPMNLVAASLAMPTGAIEVDPMFGSPFIDVDEWRDTPVRHRYVHGGFEGTQTRFSYYFPEHEDYDGRFFQHITPVPDSENLASKMPPGEYNKIGFSIDSGAYFVETNGGGPLDYSSDGGARMDSTITAYRANAAAARFSRVVAQAIYSSDERPYGYAYGGSGGGYRTIGSMENTTGAWDGAVPYVIGSTMSIPNMFTVRMHAMRVLKDQFSQIVDAVDPGGSGTPYAGLDEEQAAALREVTRMGFPMRAWYAHETMGIHAFAVLYSAVRSADPGYFNDFWTKPGYLGFDNPEQFKDARIAFETEVLEPVTAAEAIAQGIHTDPFNDRDRGGVDTAFLDLEGAEGSKIIGYRLKEAPPPVHFMGGDLIVESGMASGSELTLARIVGDVVVLGVADQSTAAKVSTGDTIRIDNSKFLAVQTYHRHQVPGSDFPVWDQFRNAAGEPLYPQRPMLLGPLFVRSTAGSLLTGVFNEKMIVVESLWDREALPWQADWYRQRVKAHLGDKIDEQFRLYYTDHALHGDHHGVDDAGRIVSYQGMLQQALRDVAAWVEGGVTPPRSTNYRVDDGQVFVPASAEKRLGIQPVVTLAVQGGDRIEVEAGAEVEFVGSIATPPNAGIIVAADWSFDGSGIYSQTSDISPDKSDVVVSATHRFETPGTYFVTLRGASQRQGDLVTPYAVIRNLARVRVVVVDGAGDGMNKSSIGDL